MNQSSATCCKCRACGLLLGHDQRFILNDIEQGVGEVFDHLEGACADHLLVVWLKG